MGLRQSNHECATVTICLSVRWCPILATTIGADGAAVADPEFMELSGYIKLSVHCLWLWCAGRFHFKPVPSIIRVS